MNHLGMAMIVLGPFGLCLAAGNIDGTTSIPLSAVLGSATTLFLVGMWVSKKVTRFEEQSLRFADQQATNMRRLDAIDARLITMEERQETNFHAINAKLDAFNERLLRRERKL